MNKGEEIFFSYEDAINNFDPYKNDPRSVNYRRIHTVPKMNWFKFSLNIAVPLFIVLTAYCFFVYFVGLYEMKSMVVLGLILLCLIYICIRIKSIVIWVVKAYQHFAPKRIRDKCRFEPSCSDYMIMSVEKYGVIKGIKKGINRIYRCSHKDGGYDYP